MSAAPVNALPARSDALRPFAARAMEATGAEGVAIALEINGEIVCAASVGAAPAVGAKVERTSTWSARCIREAQPISFSHCGERAGSSYSAILVPLLHAGRAIGCCAAFATRAEAFTPAHVRALVAIAASAVCALYPGPQPQLPAKPVADELRPEPLQSSTRVKEMGAEVAPFSSREKRRACRMIAAKSAFA